MAGYVPPLRDIRFVLEQIVELDGLSKLEAFAHADPETVFGSYDKLTRDPRFKFRLAVAAP